MATRKSDTTGTRQTPAPAKSKADETKQTPDSTASDSKASASRAPAKGNASDNYADQANKIATDARAFSENTRAALDDLVGRCNDLNQTDPGDATAAPDSLRRLPMACSDVAAALQGLAQAAAELASKTIR